MNFGCFFLEASFLSMIKHDQRSFRFGNENMGKALLQDRCYSSKRYSRTLGYRGFLLGSIKLFKSGFIFCMLRCPETIRRSFQSTEIVVRLTEEHCIHFISVQILLVLFKKYPRWNFCYSNSLKKNNTKTLISSLVSYLKRSSRKEKDNE